MKLYPLYEFPPSLEELEKLLKIIDLSPSLPIEKLREIVSQLYGKRASRTNIQIKDLGKLGLIELGYEVSLTWETQLYVDLNRSINRLLLHNSYKINELFHNCKLICQIDPEFSVSNQALYDKILEHGYTEENRRTASEKLYAIKRLIKSCQFENNSNPFLEYEQYIHFLTTLQSEYLLLASGFQKNVVISKLADALQKKGYTEEGIKRNISLLYSDPIFATYTSFSTVNLDFAKKDYYSILKEDLYYIKINKPFIKE